MPNNRRVRPRPHRVTAAAVEAYQAALSTLPARAACVAGACLGDGLAKCRSCLDHDEARLALDRALGLRPWMVSPLDADTPVPPSWANPKDAWRKGWPLARELRAELERRVQR